MPKNSTTQPSKERFRHDLQAFFIKYLDYLSYERNVSPHTLRAYHKDLQEFLEYINDAGLSLEKLQSSDFRTWFSQRRKLKTNKTGISARSQARKTAAIRSFLRFLEKRDYLSESVVSIVSSPRFTCPLPQLPKTQDLEKIFENSHKKERYKGSKPAVADALAWRDRALCEVLYSSGMRISELLNLGARELSKLPDEIKVIGKGGKERIVFLGRSARQALGVYLSKRSQLRPASEKLFLNHHGRALGDRGTRFILQQLSLQLDLSKKLSPHTLRHSFASDMLNEGSGIRFVQEMLGHSSLSTTQIYTHVSRDNLRDTYRKCHPYGKK